jgi:hypothetical protein
MPYQIRCFTTRVSRSFILPSIFLVTLAWYSSAFSSEAIKAYDKSASSGKYSARQGSETEEIKALPSEEKWDASLLGSNITLAVKINEYCISGVTIPFRIQVERIEATGSASVLSDKIINTRGIEAHSPDGLSLFRLITQLELRPGNYRLHVRAMQTTPMPPNVQTFIDAT